MATKTPKSNDVAALLGEDAPNVPAAAPVNAISAIPRPGHLRAARVWCRIWWIEIAPKQNVDHPAIEKTTRSKFCPSYEVPMVKAGWDGAARFTLRKAETHPQDWPFGGVPVRPLHTGIGMQDEIETERRRLKAVYGKARFAAVYPSVGNGDSFRAAMLKELIVPEVALRIRNATIEQVKERDSLEAQNADLFANIDGKVDADKAQARLASFFGDVETEADDE
jgi:hypothetical protein